MRTSTRPEFRLPWLPEGRVFRVDGHGELFARVYRGHGRGLRSPDAFSLEAAAADYSRLTVESVELVAAGVRREASAAAESSAG